MIRLDLVILVTLLALGSSAFAEGPGKTPQATLDAYFAMLTTRKVEDVASLMTSGSKSRLKTLMVEAFQTEKTTGGTALQGRFYGRGVTMEEVRNTPAAFFLEKFAQEILSAAEMQHFFVDNRQIIGSVSESDDMVHFVVRLFLHQDAKRNSDILVYTLIEEDGIWKLEFPPTIRQALAVFEAGLRQQAKARQ